MTQAVQTAQFGNTNPAWRNRIINGAMTIDQRNAGASVTPSAGNTYTLDRWYANCSQSSKFSVQQNAGSVTPPSGFVNYMGITSLSAYSVGAGEIFAMVQKFEGLNVYDLGWGTANAKAVALSFWVRSSLTGTFGGSVANDGGTMSYPFTFTISSANTWEYKTISVSGPTSGTFSTDNSASIRLYIGLGVGSTFSGTSGSWASADYRSATGATSVVGTNGATFYLTGVQLEVGTAATSFEFRDYGRELIMCQRYYETCSATYLQAATGAGGSNILTGQYRVTKRATPTLTLTQLNGSGGGTFTNAVDNWSASAAPDGNGRIGYSATSSAEL